MPFRLVKRRYLSFSILSNGRFKEKEILEIIQKSVLNLYGIKGLSLINPVMIEFNDEEQKGIIRCNHSHLRAMRASLAYVISIGDVIASIHVRKVSGTIKSLKS